MSLSLTQLPQFDENQRRQWWFAAAGVAMVSAVFCAVVAAILLMELIADARENPLAAKELVQLEAELKAKPDDEQKKEAYREIDQRVRRSFFLRRQFMARGGWILLGGGIVLAISLKLAFKLAERTPQPGPMEIDRAQPGKASVLARWAVAAAAVAAAVGLVVVRYVPGVPALPVATNDNATTRTAPQQGTERSAEPPVSEELMARNWPMFRGHRGTGVATTRPVPRTWDGATGKNIVWKVPVPLGGHNSPIVWEDRVFVSGSDGLKREVYCFDAKDGKLLWRKIVSTTSEKVPSERNAEEMDASYAANTMATDGRRVFATFATGDVAAFDFQGNLIWAKKFDVTANEYGHAASLLTHQNLLILQLDLGKTPNAGKSSVVALDTATGEEVWRKPREVEESWCTPMIADGPTGPQLLLAGKPWIISYKPETGEELWRYKGILGGELAPSPTFADGIAYFGTEQADLIALRLDGKGELPKSATVFKPFSDSLLPDTVSLVATDKHIFCIKGPTVACFDSKRGAVDDMPLWEARDFTSAPEGVKASPIIIGDTMYVLDSEGKMFMFSPDRVTWASIGEACQATPAFVDGRIYIRGLKNLYCIGSK